MSLKKTLGIKVLGAGKEVTPEDLALINTFALVPLTTEQVYVREYLICHNGIDRDQERFNEALLDDFEKTLPGCGFFVDGHPGWNDNGPGEGLWFSSRTQLMSSAEFKALTKEDIILSPGVMSAKVLFGKSYILRLPENEGTCKKIDAGIYRFNSIGFNAPRKAVTDTLGNYIYSEYYPSGEALETSLVWRGAQPGASAMKGAKELVPQQKTNTGGTENMIKTINNKYGKTFADTDVSGVIAFIDGKDAELATLKTEVTALKPLAEEGKAYRKHLIGDYLKASVLLGEVKNDADSQKAEEEFLMTVPIDRLKAMTGKAMDQARKAFPAEFTIKSGDPNAKREDATAPGAGSGTEGEKDAIVNDAKKRAEAAGHK